MREHSESLHAVPVAFEEKTQSKSTYLWHKVSVVLQLLSRQLLHKLTESRSRKRNVVEVEAVVFALNRVAGATLFKKSRQETLCGISH